MRAYVGVTDGGWYRFLSSRPDLQEVNFWQPSGGREFRVPGPGEPFFFKTHYPSSRPTIRKTGWSAGASSAAPHAWLSRKPGSCSARPTGSKASTRCGTELAGTGVCRSVPAKTRSSVAYSSGMCGSSQTTPAEHLRGEIQQPGPDLRHLRRGNTADPATHTRPNKVLLARPLHIPPWTGPPHQPPYAARESVLAGMPARHV